MAKKRAKRMSQREHDLAYNFLVQRDSDVCQHCSKIHAAGTKRHQIDHLDDNPENNDPTNLQLLCQPCNNTKRWEKSRAKKARDTATAKSRPLSPDDMIVLNRFGELAMTDRLREEQDTVGGPAALRYNQVFEPLVRRYLVFRLMVGNVVEEVAFIKDAAEYSGCCRKSAKEYLEKMMSPTEGTIKAIESKHSGIRLLCFRYSWMPKMIMTILEKQFSVEQLKELRCIELQEDEDR